MDTINLNPESGPRAIYGRKTSRGFCFVIDNGNALAYTGIIINHRKTMKKYKSVLLTSLFWVAVAGVVILLQLTYNTAYNRGMVKGIQTVKTATTK